MSDGAPGVEVLHGVEFFVAGRPATKGSTTAVRGRGGKVVVRASNREAQDSWAGYVAQGARAAMAGLGPLVGPVIVGTRFVLPRRAVTTTAITNGIGDLDKLVRCVWDALTGIVFVDDVQVTEIGRTSKRIALPGEQPGAWITAALVPLPEVST